MLSDITLAAPFIRDCEKRIIAGGRQTKKSVYACHRLFYVISGQGEMEFDGNGAIAGDVGCAGGDDGQSLEVSVGDTVGCVGCGNGGNGTVTGGAIAGNEIAEDSGEITGGAVADGATSGSAVASGDCAIADGGDDKFGDEIRRHALGADTLIYVPSGRSLGFFAQSDLEILSISFDFTHDRFLRRFDTLEYSPDDFLCEYISRDVPMAQPYFSDVEILRSADALLPDLMRIFDCREAQLVYFKETSEAYLKTVLCNLLSLSESGVRARRAYDRIFSYISLHYAEQIDNAELAEYVGYHTNYVNSLVLAATGTTLRQFITDFRLRRAKELLLSGKGSLDDIALACGFGTASYFCYCFKTAFGVSPHKFAKAYSDKV